MDVYQKMKELDLKILDPTPRGGIYSPVLIDDKNFLYTSGTSGANKVDTDIVGKLGKELSLEQGREAARRCAVNIISNIHHTIGDLNKIKRFVKILAFVNSADDFYDQPKVVDGASALIRDIFGDDMGMPTRSAIGVNVLPGNIPVEIEMIVELK